MMGTANLNEMSLETIKYLHEKKLKLVVLMGNDRGEVFVEEIK